jgi:hypothetical protein
VAEAIEKMVTLQMPWSDQDDKQLATMHEWDTTNKPSLIEQIALQEARRDGRVDLGDLENTISMSQAIAAVEAAAEGDSNDSELDAYRDALDEALSRWPDLTS